MQRMLPLFESLTRKIQYVSLKFFTMDLFIVSESFKVIFADQA